MSEEKGDRREDSREDSQSSTPTGPGHNWDRGLQRVQQDLASQRRAQSQLAAAVSEIREELKKIGTARAETKAKDLDDALASLEDDETVDAATLRGVLRGITGQLRESLTQEVRSLLDESLRGVRDLAADQATERFWRKWERDHPEVADRREELLERAERAVNSQSGAADYSGEQYAAALQAAFNLVVEQEEERVRSSSGAGRAARSSTGSGPSDKPPKSTEGTEVTPSGSKTAGDRGGKVLPEPGPIWVDDE